MGSAGISPRWEKRFGWFSPIPYNFFFSIGSTLAFVVVVLALAQWRLSRDRPSEGRARGRGAALDPGDGARG
jgi:hypothetical protein